MKNKIILLIAIFASFIANGEDLKNDFRYYANIKPHYIFESGSYVFNFTNEIYDKTTENFADIRIIDDNDNLMPYIIKPEMVTKYDDYYSVCKSTLLKLNKLDNNKLELIIELTDDKNLLPPNKITINTFSRNYEKTVKVFGSDNLEIWSKPLCEGRIFDFSDIANIANNQIIVSEKKCYKYYKLIIENFVENVDDKTYELIEEYRSDKNQSSIKKIKKTNQIIKINSIVLAIQKSREIANSAKNIEYKLQAFDVAQKDNKTEILLTTFKQPISSFTFKTNNLNYSRKILVEGSLDNKKFFYIKNDKISKISISNYKKNQNIISFSERRYKYYKITIFNNSSSPLDIDKIKIEGIQYQVRFIIDQKISPLDIYFGNDKIEQSHYELSNILHKINQKDLVLCTLDEVKENMTFQPEEKSSFNNKIILYIMIGIMMIILSYAIFVAIKKIETE